MYLYRIEYPVALQWQQFHETLINIVGAMTYISKMGWFLVIRCTEESSPSFGVKALCQIRFRDFVSGVFKVALTFFGVKSV